MINKSDLGLIGLREAHPTGSSPARLRLVSSQDEPLPPELGERFPRWVPNRPPSLSVGLTCPLTDEVARRLLATFHSAHADVDLTLEDLGEATLDERLQSRRIDVGIAPDGFEPRNMCRLPLWAERLVVVMPETHRLAAVSTLTAAAVLKEPILIADAGGEAEALEAALEHAFGGEARFVRQAVQRDTLLGLVALGYGVVVAGEASIAQLPAGLCARPLDDAAALLTYCAFWRPENHRPTLKAFIDESYNLCAASDGAGDAER